MGRRIVVNRFVEREVFLHNHLEGLLHQINDRFDVLTQPERKAGWKAEAMNGIIILAMLNEGWINAVGQKSISGWNPRQKSETRLRKICGILLSELSFDSTPLKSVDEVRQIRNEFAHATPFLERRADESLVVDEADQDAFFQDLRHPVDDRISVEGYRAFRKDSSQFRQLLLERSGLTYWDMRTKAEEQSTFLREVN